MGPILAQSLQIRNLQLNDVDGDPPGCRIRREPGGIVDSLHVEQFPAQVQQRFMFAAHPGQMNPEQQGMTGGIIV